jgi:EAL domain-containing protein (putative c-di-GMP-specific phosphodiesterase class I)
MTTDSNDAALVEGILAVTKHLKLRVVAEGVETIQQALFLNQRAKVLHQGYLFSRPEPMDDWLDKYPMPELSLPYRFSRRFLNNPTSKVD